MGARERDKALSNRGGGGRGPAGEMYAGAKRRVQLCSRIELVGVEAVDESLWQEHILALARSRACLGAGRRLI